LVYFEVDLTLFRAETKSFASLSPGLRRSLSFTGGRGFVS